MSRRRALLLILLIWLVASLLSAPNVLNSRYFVKYFYSARLHELQAKPSCQVMFAHREWYENCLLVVQYVLPLLVLTYTFARILFALRDDNFPSAARVVSHKKNARDKQKVSILLRKKACSNM